MVTGARRAPVKDELATNLGFVDVLFAIVVGKIIDLSLADNLPDAAVTQLVLAATVTLTSYIGYRNSLNRPRYLIRAFVNVPFWQFAVDVALVYAYVNLATSVEDAKSTPTALPECRWLFIVAVLYLTWDGLAALIRFSTKYEDRPLSRANWNRTAVSLGFLVVTAAVAVALRESSGESSRSVVAFDLVLTGAVIAYRIAKELVPTNLPEPRTQP